ncbi:MAG: hypothetical protein QOH57_873 [Mycobacterium sp.]|nr:hypothetical protein [Mycobacterium sp.]
MRASLRAAAALAVALVAAATVRVEAAAESPCVDFGGAVDGNTCQVHTANGAYMLDIVFPVDYADPAPMVDYLRQTRDGFVNVAGIPGSTGLPYALDVTSELLRSGPPPAGTQTAALKLYQNVGGAHPLTWYKAFNYNLTTHQPITFDTLFIPGSKPLPAILPAVQKAVDTQLGSHVKLSGGLDPSHYQNFALTDDELIFYFDQGDMLPSAAGALTVHLPRASIAPMLAPLG